MKNWLLLNIHRICRLLDKGWEFIHMGKDSVCVYSNRILTRSGKSSSRPSRKLIFHVGFRKTGTSSIQKFLSKNASVLRRRVDVSTRFLEPSTDKLRKAGTEWSKNDNRRNALKFEAAAVRFGKALLKLPHNTAIISDENIIGHNILIDSEDIFTISSRILKRLEMALSEFDIHFIIYTRNRDSWLESCYAQDVRWHRFSGTFEEWLENRRSIRNWDEGCSILCDNLRSKVTFISMENELDKKIYLGTSLLEVANLTSSMIKELEPCPPQNTSLTPVQLEFMRKINKLGMAYSRTHKVAKVVSANQKLFRKETEKEASFSPEFAL